jgi:sulfoxide reductase heme-binding subunit YedZ
MWILCLLPAALLAWDGYTDDLTAEPIREITHRTGWWALTLLLVSLSVTPLRRLTGWNPLIKLRRPLGLFAFFYACLHVLTYFGLDQFFALAYIVEDVLERPYITVGFTAWMLLVPLAVTSTQGWIRRLGKRWQRLHRLVYASAALGVLHFLWAVKADTREPFLFALALALLLAFRLPAVQRALPGRRRVRKPPPPRLAEVGGEG